MRKGFFLPLVLCLVPLLFLISSTRSVSSERNDINNILKVSADLRTAVSKFTTNDTLLVWLDVYIPPLPDGNFYLCSTDLSQVIDIGAKIAGVTFSPDRKLLWYLVEVCAEDVFGLVNLPMVQNVSLAMIGVWDWWDKPWQDVISVDPLLGLTAQRVTRDFANTSVQVVINYADVFLNQTEKGKHQISGEISTHVKSVGGKVTRTGLAEYVLAEVPPNELNRLFENKYVRTLEALHPVYLRGGSFRKLTSYRSESSLFMLLLPLCVAWYSMRKPSKLKSALIVLLVFTVFLLPYNILSTYALPVSRRAIRADETVYHGNGIVVAVIDSGIDFNHGDLEPAILQAVDMTGHNDPMDYSGHGTHVAGIVASQSGIYTGIAPGARIISLKIGIDTTLIDDAIQWCIDEGDTYNIGVIQLSCGDLTEQPGDGTDPLSMKADEAVEAGIPVVVAVIDQDTNGNGEYELSNPEQAFNVIAVGAVNDEFTVNIDDDTLAYYSGHGETKGGRPKPDVVAPGDGTDDPSVGIWSTRSAQAPAGHYEAVNGAYGRMSGTSMAAPHVSGTVALILEANPDLTPAQVKAVVRQTARVNDNLEQLTVNDRGHGIIDAYEAVQLAQSVSNIDINHMYDSWDVSTPGRDLGLGCYDYLTFTVAPPSCGLGINMMDVQYHYRHPIPICNKDYELIHDISAQHVWIDGIYHHLGNNMHKYLLNGPRIYYKADYGAVFMKAWFKIGNKRILYNWFMGVDQVRTSLYFLGGSQWKTLMYIDTDVWADEGNYKNYPYLPSTDETILIETKITGDVLLNVRDLDHTEYVQIDPSLESYNPTMWVLRCGYYGNNPDATIAKNDEYVYNRDIVIYYQQTSENPSVTIYRKTDSLPSPNPNQNDAGTGEDAGNSFDTATSISSGSYEGILCSSDPTDTDDWYQFYAESGKIISLSMTPPYDIDFDLQLYDPSGNLKDGSYNGPGYSDGIAYTADSSGNWRARIYIVEGEAQYSFSVSVYSSGGGCPFVYAWNGTHYVIDNNLLAASAWSNGEEVGDYYKLEQSLVPTYEGDHYSLYSLRLAEFQQEHSYLDQAKLIAVDHDANVNVAVSPFGEILTYQNPDAPISAADDQGYNQMEAIQSIDMSYYEGYNGSYLLLNFGEVTAENAKLIMRADRPPVKTSIHIQVLNSTEDWVDVVSIIPRTYWATEIIDLSTYLPSTREFKVRLYFTDSHKVDYVGLDTTSQAQIDVQDARLILAYHSDDGVVTTKLRTDDDIYAELIPGQQITLLFAATTQNGGQRTFIIYVKGYYTILDN